MQPSSPYPDVMGTNYPTPANVYNKRVPCSVGIARIPGCWQYI
jgi:hypothetical protein